MDYKTVFINLCLELPQNLSWIKGLGKNPFTHSIPFTHSLTAVHFVRGHRSVFPRTPRNTGVYTRHPTFVTCHEWRVDTASGLTLKKQNACLHAVRHAVGNKIACIHGFRSEGVKGYPLNISITSRLFHITIQQIGYLFNYQSYTLYQRYYTKKMGHLRRFARRLM